MISTVLYIFIHFLPWRLRKTGLWLYLFIFFIYLLVQLFTYVCRYWNANVIEKGNLIWFISMNFFWKSLSVGRTWYTRCKNPLSLDLLSHVRRIYSSENDKKYKNVRKYAKKYRVKLPWSFFYDYHNYGIQMYIHTYDYR